MILEDAGDARVSGRTPRRPDEAKPPLITVLTPTFNRSEMLKLTLASVRMQSYGAIEHIVIDGGSTDGTLAVLRNAEALWGTRWISQSDGGMYEALNKGLKMANGSVVGWVNSDDWLLPWTCSSVAANMMQIAYDHAVYGDVLSTTPGKDMARASIYGRFNRRGLATVTTLAQPTVFWPLAATSKAGLLDTFTYRQIADCEYWLRLSKTIPFMKMRDFMAIVVNHPETKRQSLADQIRVEFSILRDSNRPANCCRPWERTKNALRWRWELALLVSGRGWGGSRDSPLVDIGLAKTSAFRSFLAYGPQRRHPLRRLPVDIAGFREQLKQTAAELDSKP